MGRRCQQRGKSECGSSRKVTIESKPKNSTTRNNRGPTLVRDCKPSAGREQPRGLPIAGRGSGTRRPFHILVFCRKGKAKRVALKPLVAGRKSSRARKLSGSRGGHRKNHAAPKLHPPKITNNRGRWHVALDSKPTQVAVNDKNSLVRSGDSPPAKPDAVHLRARSTALVVSRLPVPVSRKPKENLHEACCENRPTGCPIPMRGRATGPGPCTRSRSGGTGDAVDSLPHRPRTRLSASCVNAEAASIVLGRAGDDKEPQTYTTRRSLRKRASLEADIDSTCNGSSSLLATAPPQTPSLGRKKRRLTQGSVDQSMAMERAETVGTSLPPSKVVSEASISVSERQPTVPKRRRGNRRRIGPKRRGSQKSSQRKIEVAPTAALEARPVEAAVPEQTKLSCFLYFPEDPTRPLCRPAIAFEPADLCLGFNGILEWPCVVANAASVSPDCASEVQEQPRFSLCGGLPDPPRSPPWLKKTTLSSDDECPEGLYQRHNLETAAEAACKTTGTQCGTECREETPHRLCSEDSAPGASGFQEFTTDQTCHELSGKENQSQSPHTGRETTATQLTNGYLEHPPHEDEDDHWTFTPPDPERAQEILNYMGDTIRRIIATTQAAQRRTEMYSQFFDRLLNICHQNVLR